MRLNRNVLIGLGAGAVALLLFAPKAVGVSALPLLLLLACPLSMVFMMRGMSRSKAATPDPVAPAGEPDTEVARLRAERDRLEAAKATRRPAAS
ncbi:MAG: DUF2933 domain-containing protein [Acidimicrobiales bacterium]